MCTHSISVKLSSYWGYGWLLYRSLGAISVLRCQYWNPHCIDQITFDHLITTIWIHTSGDKIIFDHLIALSYVHTCAGRLRSGGGRILTFPLRYCGMFTHTWSGRGQICHFLRTMMVWSARFRSGRGKLGVGPISCGADFAPAPPPLRDRACVNTCNDLCWSQFSAHLRPRPPAHVWTYLNWEIVMITWSKNKVIWTYSIN